MTPAEAAAKRHAKAPTVLNWHAIIFYGGYALFLLAVATLGFVRCGPRAFAASRYQACDQTMSTVVTPHIVYIYPSVDTLAWNSAISEWNAHYPDSFIDGNFDDASVLIAWTPGRTWVDMPCNGHRATIYVGNDVSIAYWAVHELGHAGFALRDWIRVGQPRDGYINPGTCPGEYAGLMSYCTSREGWWGADDDRMILSLRGYQSQ